jgi:predicted nuclease of predicted toxin-antitoxin system
LKQSPPPNHCRRLSRHRRVWARLENPPKSLIRAIRDRIAGRAKWLVDESLGEGVARAIRDLGLNVKFVADFALAVRSDEEVFAYAWKERRILLTHDRDFLDDGRFPFTRNPGVIVLPGGHGREHGLARALRAVLSVIGENKNLFPNAKIEISNDNTWNVRHFERDEGRVRHTRLQFRGDGTLWKWEE